MISTKNQASNTKNSIINIDEYQIDLIAKQWHINAI